jgi:hypothetical protein
MHSLQQTSSLYTIEILLIYPDPERGQQETDLKGESTNHQRLNKEEVFLIQHAGI